jgi:hypothetical protein
MKSIFYYGFLFLIPIYYYGVYTYYNQTKNTEYEEYSDDD